MANTGGNGNRRGTGRHAQHAWISFLPPCPKCEAPGHEPCTTPKGRERKPHLARPKGRER